MMRLHVETKLPACMPLSLAARRQEPRADPKDGFIHGCSQSLGTCDLEHAGFALGETIVMHFPELVEFLPIW